jgi:hypothetical protein
LIAKAYNIDLRIKVFKALDICTRALEVSKRFFISRKNYLLMAETKSGKRLYDVDHYAWGPTGVRIYGLKLQ